ncbi:MAG: hypothetical protein ACYTHK_04380 [Planctomycetota bacterium]
MRRMGSFAVLTLVLASCQSTPEARRILDNEIFEDIPAPRTARVQTDSARSFSYASESFRCAKYVYFYVGEVEEATEFFSTTMTRPPYSWDLVKDDELPSGHARMSFTKGEEYCVVDMRTTTRRDSDDDLVTITIRVNYQ